jgi:hypothetical protein
MSVNKFANFGLKEKETYFFIIIIITLFLRKKDSRFAFNSKSPQIEYTIKAIKTKQNKNVKDL